MESDLRVDILANGLLVSTIWYVGAYFAWWRRRWMLTVGLILAGSTAVAFTILSAGGDLPGWVVAVASYARTPVALLLVGSFVWNQPRGGRPQSWLP